MEFYTAAKEKRPVRLSEETRRFAQESLNGKYGDGAMQTPAVCMDTVSGFAAMTESEKYDAIIRKIAEEAPLRYCEGEKISGAATLGNATQHLIPAIYQGENVFFSVSHLTLGFKNAVIYGINAKERAIEARLRQQDLPQRQRETLCGMKNAVESLRVWHRRYLTFLEEKAPGACLHLAQVPFGAPRSFHEAVQSLWFLFAFERLCGNWPGIGRLDDILGSFLENDLRNGVLTLSEAREILAHFFIKGCEWIRSERQPGSGDAQHYQNIVLGGINENGEEITNDVTYLVLDIVEELPIGDFPITVRLNRQTPARLKEKIAAVIRHGGGVVAVYNEETVLQALKHLNYEETEARGFANDGCWEVQIPGKTYFEYVPFDGLGLLLNGTLHLNSETPASFDSYEALYQAYLTNLRAVVESIAVNVSASRGSFSEAGEWIWHQRPPCAVVSLLEDGCIETGRSYLESGVKYSVVSPHFGGAADTANSLYAIKKLVFEEQKLTLAQLLRAVQEDWQNDESLRVFIRNKVPCYGNDNDEADAVYAVLLDDFAKLTADCSGKTPVIITSGISTFGRQIEWRGSRGATPFGTHRNEILAANASPSPGTDLAGATAVIRSHCKADLTLQGTGAALDLRLHPSTVAGENGIKALIALLDGFCALGGFFLQIDIVSAETLYSAQRNPEAYRSLSVRVSGWNARFITLDKEWQQMIIEKTEHSH